MAKLEPTVEAVPEVSAGGLVLAEVNADSFGAFSADQPHAMITPAITPSTIMPAYFVELDAGLAGITCALGGAAGFCAGIGLCAGVVHESPPWLGLPLLFSCIRFYSIKRLFI